MMSPNSELDRDFCKAVSVETANTLGPMLSGEVPLPAMPEPEDAIERF